MSTTPQRPRVQLDWISTCSAARARRRNPYFLGLLLACASVCVLSLPARAEIPPILRPGTRAFFGAFTLGPAINLTNSPTQFKLSQEAGWFLGRRPVGFAVGLALHESFGDNWTWFQIGPKAWFSFQPVPDLGLYVVPFVQLGFAHGSFSIEYLGFDRSGSSNFFNWQFGVEGRLMFDDRFYALFRPMAIDLFHGDGGTAVRWDLLFGGGVTF